MNLLELKDSKLCLRTPQAVLATAPGFVSIADKTPLFGEAAQQVARLYPRQTFNQFWHQLSLDPLLIKTKLFRHHADLAHAQLQHLAQSSRLDDGVIVAAPTSYTRPQLAVLLGILKQCSFKTLSIVDHALLQAMSTGSPDCIVIDLQLHQAVLASFRVQDGLLQKVHVVQVPGAGLLALHDAWSSVVVDAFLQQSRFDPTHSAETEQYLNNQLSTWLQASTTHNELLLEINHKGKVHQANLHHGLFAQRTQALFARISRELDQLRGTQTSVHIDAAHLYLPGLTHAFSGVCAIAEDAALHNAQQQKTVLLQNTEALSFITKMPLAATASNAAVSTHQQPTHLLFQHQAIALPQGRLLLGNSDGQAGNARAVNITALHGSFALQRSLRNVNVADCNKLTLRCNGEVIMPGHELKLGDVLQVEGYDPSFQLITVE